MKQVGLTSTAFMALLLGSACLLDDPDRDLRSTQQAKDLLEVDDDSDAGESGDECGSDVVRTPFWEATYRIGAGVSDSGWEACVADDCDTTPRYLVDFAGFDDDGVTFDFALRFVRLSRSATADLTLTAPNSTTFTAGGLVNRGTFNRLEITAIGGLSEGLGLAEATFFLAPSGLCEDGGTPGTVRAEGVPTSVTARIGHDGSTFTLCGTMTLASNDVAHGPDDLMIHVLALYAETSGPGDEDGDGICDDEDPCIGPGTGDADGDGICDASDDCFGPGAGDADGDGFCDGEDDCFGPGWGDEDGDTVCDGADFCLGTVLPDQPTEGLGVNRWAAEEDGTFRTRQPKGVGPRLAFTLEETGGCSCAQIIDALGLGQGHVKHGCSISAMCEWTQSPLCSHDD